MKTFFSIIATLISSIVSAQTIESRLAAATKELEKDPQFSHAIISLYVVNNNTGKTAFEKNAQLGLAPASCQKLITSAAAYELLGNNYQYKTALSYTGEIKDSTLNGDLYIIPSGDPTLGSWRWSSTDAETIKQKILSTLRAMHISVINGDLVIDDSKWETQATPRGWTWEDIGNYYGAGARALNWHENQYDLILQPGKKVGDSVDIIATRPELQVALMVNELTTGPQRSGDQSIIYLPEDGQIGYIRGTVPAVKETFIVKGSLPNASNTFLKTISDCLDANGIRLNGKYCCTSFKYLHSPKSATPLKPLLTLTSPTLDSINYWFLQESINLYGEAIVKTLAYVKKNFGSADSGLAIIKDCWANRGVDRSSLNILDGSGLSPANRVTTNALVTIMQYARKQNWYPSFYHSIPEINGIKMKSGYIGGARSYTGYIKSKTGEEYTFSFIINNYDGSPVPVREKMWKLLDILK